MRFTFAATAALVTVVALAGCSSSAGSPSMMGMNHGSSPMNSAPASNASFNTADVDFTTGMIPHHTQAVRMVDVLAKKTGIDPAVTTLATKIKAEQGPEITTMTSWLTDWKVPTATGMGMDHGMGMMSDAEMSALDSATGAPAAKLFLTQMMQHHEGAISMATTEVSHGKNTEAVALARNIITTQTTEIASIKSLLATL